MSALHCVIIFSSFGPYHVARLAGAVKSGNHAHCVITGLEIAPVSETYAWSTEKPDKELRIVSLFPERILETVSQPSQMRRMWQALASLNPDLLAISGYDRLAMLTALAWAKKNRKSAILMSDSKADDQPRQRWREWLKSQIVRRFDAALVAGTPQKDYATSLGIPAKRVFLGYDVVNNSHYALGAAAARRQAQTYRQKSQKLNLPTPYFLTVARFIEKKNLFRLVEAYRQYRKRYSDPWDLVICGSGPQARELQAAAAEVSGIHFPGFKQLDELPIYYGLASAFILASSHFEQWGLVVNEAMAAGLPVLVSRACGCAPDLVREGVNGFTFDPYDVGGLAGLMVRMSSGELNLKAMGEASQVIIAGWTPEVFGENLLRAVDAARGS
ncbi:MAG TPA: glycosyltransferase family 4 protein [Desulfobaccales bacterium]|nr:glycosyltransferase family 4 protein [Desulfobaccales bacterium]